MQPFSDAPNPYVYVNNPLRYIDPTGEDAILSIEHVALGAGFGHAALFITDPDPPHTVRRYGKFLGAGSPFGGNALYPVDPVLDPGTWLKAIEVRGIKYIKQSPDDDRRMIERLRQYKQDHPFYDLQNDACTQFAGSGLDVPTLSTGELFDPAFAAFGKGTLGLAPSALFERSPGEPVSYAKAIEVLNRLVGESNSSLMPKGKR